MELNHEDIVSTLDAVVSVDTGFEVHPFKVGWYNDVVSSAFKLPYSPECAGLLLLSTPNMFQHIFIPWLRDKYNNVDVNELEIEVHDPLDACMKYIANKCSQQLKPYTSNITVIHDFDLWPSRKPKILMPTCGHICGAAHYYKWSDVCEKSGGIGVSLHPNHGGYFAFRFVLILDDFVFGDLTQKLPIKSLKCEEEILEALNLFTHKWFEEAWRNITQPKLKYSHQEKLYFDTLPAHRWKIIKQWLGK